ncbi:hypothetical protein GQX74_004246 [Glossina fuscipes]|nr:hypothetical protein GQX74_004246 [Glossina fuscipes]
MKTEKLFKDEQFRWRSNDCQTNLVSSKTTFAVISINSNSKMYILYEVGCYKCRYDQSCPLAIRGQQQPSDYVDMCPIIAHHHKDIMNFVIAILFLYAAACAFRCVVVHMHVLGVQVLISICLFSAVHNIYSLNSAPVFILSGCPFFSLRLVYMG